MLTQNNVVHQNVVATVALWLNNMKAYYNDYLVGEYSFLFEEFYKGEQSVGQDKPPFSPKGRFGV